jgi:tricorn protease
VTVLKLWRLSTGEIVDLTEPLLRDVSPAFDPDGKYLYFLSYRHFDPVYDNLHFDLNFPRGVKPYLITLQKDAPPPFVLQPKVEEEDEKKETEAEKSEEGKAEAEQKEKKKEEKPVHIDLEGIERRIVSFPVEEGRRADSGLKEGSDLLFTRSKAQWISQFRSRAKRTHDEFTRGSKRGDAAGWHLGF